MGVFDVLKIKNGVAQGIRFESVLGEGLYSGQVNSSRLPNGQGMFVNSVGVEYEGNWENGVLNGFGKKYAKGYYDTLDDENAGTSLVYAGDFADNKFHGKGKQFSYSGKIEYDGDYKEGWKSGHGVEYYENGTVKYEGDWLRDKYHGAGLYHYKNGNVLEGKWKEGQLNGDAVLKKTDGSSYKRIYKDDEVIKEQILTARTDTKKVIDYGDGDKYEGEVNKAGEPHGRGTMFYKDGSRHEGEYLNGSRNGHGVFYYSTGDRYDGEWKDGVYDGHGIICYKDGDIFECDFKEGKENGYGLFICTDGRILRQVWENGSKVSEEKVDVGEGSSFVMKRTVSYSNGNKYEGEVSLSGERSGYGSLIMVNGDKYEGEWANDVKHGHGVEVWATGARYEGEWKDGKKDGEGILTGRGGIKSKQVWENGKLISQEPIRKE